MGLDAFVVPRLHLTSPQLSRTAGLALSALELFRHHLGCSGQLLRNSYNESTWRCTKARLHGEAHEYWRQQISDSNPQGNDTKANSTHFFRGYPSRMDTQLP